MSEKTKIWGVGLGRTGTKSLVAALRMLGYQKVLHNPTDVTILSCAEAAVEGPCMRDYQTLDTIYPGSKFILTTRDVETWIESAVRAMSDDMYPLARFSKSTVAWQRACRNRLARFGCIHPDVVALRRHYYKHHYEVYDYFGDRDDLLTINIMEDADKDLWDKLWAATSKGPINQPFPYVKD